ncbi:sigma-54 interaction domain-containing protein [Caenispirillum salinarum]|uniref:sigma-54 interaction domain-containing protein n=1 Tax=Caenispirillum salinarum TaxID=859058 RepID=UPI00384C6D36
MTDLGMAAYGDLIGDHPSIRAVRALIAKVARSPASTVLIYGETGTGKGLVARMVHQQSSRAQERFVDVNCAAIPPSLMESELFGHERGAFTGAAQKKTGLVEAAHHGTLFLDEIREMELTQQTKLLSLLDTQQFRRVGATRPIDVDVRFIAATNRILLSEVREGRFREDLYYRLQVVSINIPPLRARGEDVLILAEHFIRKFNARYDRRISGLTPAAADVFRQYRWPGNVRELENLLERIFILEEDDEIDVAHLPSRIRRDVGDLPAQAVDGLAWDVDSVLEAPMPDLPEPAGDTGAAADAAVMAPARMPQAASGGAGVPATCAVWSDFHTATNHFQETLIRDALARAKGNQTEAAGLLGLSRHALRHHMLKLDIR